MLRSTCRDLNCRSPQSSSAGFMMRECQTPPYGRYETKHVLTSLLMSRAHQRLLCAVLAKASAVACTFVGTLRGISSDVMTYRFRIHWQMESTQSIPELCGPAVLEIFLG